MIEDSLTNESHSPVSSVAEGKRFALFILIASFIFTFIYRKITV
uniref:Transporter n=1 Tax=Ascaris lumbricoides TaxID=6252 RepID=A0A0M3ICF0_ASCLU